MELATVLLTFHCMSLAKVLYVSLMRGQLVLPRVRATAGREKAQCHDNDIARHCAFSLPAVALTLGRTNWPLIKETYETLANDMQWKVRRTVASSIHELGVILGEEIAAEDLVPIFDGFIKDLDEVNLIFSLTGP